MTTIPEPDDSRMGRARDRLAWWIANFAMNHIATPWYRGMITGSIRLGLQKAAEDG